MLKVVIGKTKLTLTAAQQLAEGGEATVFDLGNGTVAKIWKTAAHPDFARDPLAQAAATARIAAYTDKLRLLRNLPACLAGPLETVQLPSGTTAGFVMRKVSGELLVRYADPRFCQAEKVGSNHLLAILRNLHAAICVAHAANLVIGDFNDLNVLVDGAAVTLLDVDSYSIVGTKHVATMFCDRFIDPRLVTKQGGQLALKGPMDRASDWFAFAVMVTKLLLWASPWGGSCPLPPSERLLARVTLFDDQVIYPRAAKAKATLPAALRQHLQHVFAGPGASTASPFPVALLDATYATCQRCGVEHANAQCACGAAHPTMAAARVTGPAAPHTATPSQPGATVHQNVHATPFDASNWAAPSWAVPNQARPHDVIWRSNTALFRRVGPLVQTVGTLLANQTHVYTDGHRIAGFYRLGSITYGLCAGPRGTLGDWQIGSLPGTLVASHAHFGDDTIWLVLTTTLGASLQTTVIALRPQGVVATQTFGANHSLVNALPGAVAAGNFLLVPTDDGIVRLDCHFHATHYPQTTPWVTANCQLGVTPHGILVVPPDSRRNAVLLRLT